MPEFLVWEEPRLTASGFVTTFVLSVGSKSRWVCRRQDEGELRRLKELCEKSGLETIHELKELVKGAKAEKKDTSAPADRSKQDSAKAEQQDTSAPADGSKQKSAKAEQKEHGQTAPSRTVQRQNSKTPVHWQSAPSRTVQRQNSKTPVHR